MKQMYEAPEVQVIDIEVQTSVMQASPGTPAPSWEGDKY